MQVHQIEVKNELRHVVDPIQGHITRVEQVLKQGGAVEIAAGEHGVIPISADGTFNVPDELGETLLRQDGWYEGANPLADLYEQQHFLKTGEDANKQPQKSQKAAA